MKGSDEGIVEYGRGIWYSLEDDWIIGERMAKARPKNVSRTKSLARVKERANIRNCVRKSAPSIAGEKYIYDNDKGNQESEAKAGIAVLSHATDKLRKSRYFQEGLTLRSEGSKIYLEEVGNGCAGNGVSIYVGHSAEVLTQGQMRRRHQK